MKTRNDFVSNSSSCSFVVAIPSEDKYKFKDFVNDIVKDCASNKDEKSEMTKEAIDNLNAFNARNLDYHLNSSELLFLGTLKVNNKQYTIVSPDLDDKMYVDSEHNYNYDIQMFNELQKDIKKKSFGKYTGEKLVESTKDKVTISYPIYASSIAFPTLEMEYFTGHYDFIDPAKETKKDRKYAAEQIINLVNSIKNLEDSDLYNFINTHTYFISKRTIWNTRALLENKADLVFDKWEDLDALEKRLDEGQRLFVIRQNNGGDGWDSDAVYALGGWDCKFGDKAVVEILYSECS